MPITDITAKVISESKKEAEKILEEAREREKIIEKELSEIKKNLVLEEQEVIKKLLEENQRKHVSSVQQKSRSLIDNLKREALDRVFKKSLEKIEGLKDRDYKSVVSSYLEKLPKDLKGEIIVNPDKEKITSEILSEKNISLPIKTKEGLGGGFLFEGESFEYDFTFKKILEGTKENAEIEVSKILFG